jgi:3-oxoacyl-[acyl-carrier-protein] synthase III
LGSFFGDGAGVVVVGEGHEAAQRDGPQGKLHAAALAFQQHRPEADREAAHADALPGGGKEVAGLMHHDQARQDRQCRENTHSGSAA